MPLVKMLTTSATPERILEHGKVYNLPRALFKELLKGDPNDSRPYIEAIDHLPKGVKLSTIPSQPDPEDNAAVVTDDDYLEDEKDSD